MFRCALVFAVVASGCAVAPRVIVADEDSDRIDAMMKPEAFDADSAAMKGIALSPDAPRLAEPFPDSRPWQRYLPARRGSGGLHLGHRGPRISFAPGA